MHTTSTRRTRSLISLLMAITTAAVSAMTPAIAAATIQSDDFHATTLNTSLWTTVDPRGDAVFYPTGTNLWIHVPGRSRHTLWSDCTCAPMLLQAAPNTDFGIEARFESIPTRQYQMQGLVVREDADTYLRFDVHHDGSTPRIYAAYINGVNPPSTKINASLPSIPAYLRVTRTADNWNFLYSDNGTTWTSAGTFSRALIVADLGLFAGNEDGASEYNTPEFTANVDYFFNTASPITPEDGGVAAAAAGPMIDIWYGDTQSFGQLGTPQNWVDIVGSVWSPDSVASLTYALNGGATNALGVGPDGARLVGYGDYNIEIAYDDLLPGANEIVISAQDSLGQIRDTTVTVNYTDGIVWSLPDTASWSTASSISDEAHVVDGKWRLDAGGVRVDSMSAGFERTLVLGDRTWTPDYEATLPFTVNAADIGGSGRVGLIVGWQSHNGSGQPLTGGAYQTVAWVNQFTTTPTLRLIRNGGAIAAETPVTTQVGQKYYLKVQSQTLGSGESRVKAKFWKDGDAEPGTWGVEETFIKRDGSILMVADNADVTFGDAVVTPVATLGHTLTTNTVGNGSIDRAPNFTLYADSAVVQLTAVPDAGYTFSGWSGGLSGSQNPASVTVVSDTSVTASFVPAIVSDDFHASELDTTLWRVFDPSGGATTRMSGTNLLFEVPGGTSHDLWSDCNCAPRMLQSSYDTDFEVEVKYDARGRLTSQGQGVIVQQDDDTYLRFDVVYNSSSYSLFAAYIDGSTAVTKINTAPTSHPTYVRVKRTGSLWTFRYSTDGSTWKTGGSFSQALAVTEVGFSAINDNLDPYSSPAFVSNVDYFFNAAFPIVPEDGGQPSAETPPLVDVWYGDTQNVGQLGVPQRWVNILGRVSDSEPIASLSYTLNGGASNALNVGPNGQRLVGVGEFIVEIDYDSLQAGANDVVITAVDTLGEQTDHMVTLNHTDGIAWQIPYTADWSAVSSISEAAQVVAGDWDLDASGVRTVPGATGFDRCVVVGDRTWPTEYEALVPLTIHGGNLGGTSAVGFVIGWQGHTGSTQPRENTPFQTAAWIRDVPTSPRIELRDDEIVHTQSAISFTTGALYYLKIRSEAVTPSEVQVRMKLWQDGQSEPAGWDLTDNFGPRDGSVLLVAHYADVTFGNVSVTPLSSFPQHVLGVQVVGNGTVQRTPDYPTYPDSAQVVLTAVPDPGWTFVGWSGGLSGSANPDTVFMVSDTTVTATFVEGGYTLTRNVVGNGSISATPDLGSYLAGDTVIVTAVPDPDWAFDSWSDGLSGSENPDTLVMGSDTTIAATFLRTRFTLTRSVVGNGSIAASPDTSSYAIGDTVVVTALPDSNWAFDSWTEGLSGSENPDTLVIAGDTTVTATFVQTRFALVRNVVGSGSISVSPDTSSYATGDTVIVTATPDGGWVFAGWSGALSGSQNPDTLVMVTDTTVTATFTPTQFTLDVTVVGSGTVVKDPDQALYNPGTSVTLIAVPDSGWVFLGWSGDLTGKTPIDSVAVNSNISVTATFGAALYTVTTAANGSGSVARVPNRAKYALGEKIALTANPASGWVFIGWSDALTGTQNPDTLTVAGDTTVTANFSEQQYSIDISIVGTGSVTKKPNRALYAPGETVVLTAYGIGGMAFQSWSGDLTGTANPDTFVVDSSMAITATFSTVSGIGDTPALSQLTVMYNTPNPFTHGTSFQYGLPAQADVSIDVYDAAGRRVYAESIPGASAGWHNVRFEGIQSDGRRLPSGVYFYRVQALGRSVTRKMVIVR